MKGYLTPFGYMGLIGDTYHMFVSEEEYREYVIISDEHEQVYTEEAGADEVKVS